MAPLAIAAEAALPEVAGAGAGAEAGGGLGGLGRLGGMMKDFNDNPVAKIAGSFGGKLVHAATSAIGTGGYPEERAPIGPMGSI